MVMACYSEAGTCAVMRNYAAHEDIWSWKDGAFMKLPIHEIISWNRSLSVAPDL